MSCVLPTCKCNLSGTMTLNAFLQSILDQIYTSSTSRHSRTLRAPRSERRPANDDRIFQADVDLVESDTLLHGATNQWRAVFQCLMEIRHDAVCLMSTRASSSHVVVSSLNSTRKMSPKGDDVLVTCFIIPWSFEYATPPPPSLSSLISHLSLSSS